jgi:hypothetical protein
MALLRKNNKKNLNKGEREEIEKTRIAGKISQTKALTRRKMD